MAGTSTSGGYQAVEADNTAPAVQGDVAKKVLEPDIPGHNELFNEENDHAWWLANLFPTQPIFFGTWDGVFTTCLIHLVGAIVFLRAGWIVGNAGIEQSLLIVGITAMVCCIALVAGVGITQRCHIDTGGVHDILSHILGARLGGAVSVVYCFGQAVSCALHLMAFAESMGLLLNFKDDYIQKAIAVVSLMCVLGINLAGVKWVVRIQFVLLVVLLLALSDFGVGIFVKKAPESGVTGLNATVFVNNLNASYMDGQNWFTIFGLFFPAMTGVCAGINMSSDLLQPAKNIPTGTFSAIGTSVLIYVAFILGLGATCERWALQNDYMIAEKVSAVSFLLLTGLYISSMSSSLGSLYATPRILQRMAIDGILPGSPFLSEGKGPNKVPVSAMLLFSAVTLAFVLAGNFNQLAPIVTIPFLITYASVEYAYFNMAVTYKIQKERREKFDQHPVVPSNRQYAAEVATPMTGSPTHQYGAPQAETTAPQGGDLERLFPERVTVVRTRSRASSSSSSPLTSPGHSSLRSAQDEASALIRQETKVARIPLTEVARKPDTWYFRLFNKWVALLGAVLKVTIMFLVEWRYSSLSIAAIAILYVYINKNKPQSHSGISEWSLHSAAKNSFFKCIGRQAISQEQVVVSPPHPGGQFTSSQLNYEGNDYANRKRYHQTTTVQPAHHYQDFDGD
ncbi:solute carrier family 12 member 8 [Galendromus occidentalis]|uniref:Solute carrier family 12 member 8 n=1 Tax=Galendromus occidentalis TaxID=34638 RepID=A0AAJ7L666_9ACAR|nr:solute carrier family 12 member 8 [Galendromus occidentalis]